MSPVALVLVVVVGWAFLCCAVSGVAACITPSHVVREEEARERTIV